MRYKGQALEGLRVLDLGQVIAGNFCSVLLADFGAYVIKIERPKVGDGIRYMGSAKDGVSTTHILENRNKHCITLDLKSVKGKEIFFRLLKDADVVVENFAPGVLERMGLGYDVLKKVNPRVILARISGFGQTGPNSSLPGYDRVGIAYGGLTYITGEPDGAPMKPGVGVADYCSGVFMAMAVMMAIYNRDVVGTGEGQQIDLALFESPFRILENTVVEYDLFGTVRERTGNGHPNTAPGNNYLTKDGKWVVVASGNDRVFSRFAKAINRLDLLDDPRFKTNADRTGNQEHKRMIDDICRAWVADHTEKECERTFRANDVPYGAVLSIADIFKEEHYWAREDIIETAQDKIGKVKMQGIVPKFSRTPGQVRWGGASLGYFNKEIYQGELGFTDEEMRQLEDEGII